MTGVPVEWGVAGARRIADLAGLVVVVDVLSFTTVVSVATARDVTVYPHRWRDDSADHRARLLGATLAGERGTGPSLSPVSIAAMQPGESLVLPSPNGAACVLAAAANGATVVAASLRNAGAVASWLAERDGLVGFVAAGERWPDGSLRPAYEDLVGVGEVVRGLPAAWPRSAEASAAELAAAHRRPLSDVLSGRELIERGYPEDVSLAELVGVDGVVPVLVDGAFVDARVATTDP